MRTGFWKNHMALLPAWARKDPDVVRPMIASCAAVIKAGDGRPLPLLPSDLNSPGRAAAYQAGPDAIMDNIASALRSRDSRALEDFGTLADLVLATLTAGDKDDEPVAVQDFSLIANNIFMRMPCAMEGCRNDFERGEWVVSADGSRNGAVCNACAQRHAPHLARLVRYLESEGMSWRTDFPWPQQPPRHGDAIPF